MNLATALIEHFLNTPFQMFTEKLISAFMISNVLEFNKKDLERLKFIESDTMENINVPLYQIDRFINPTKGEFKTKMFQKEFITTVRNKDSDRLNRIIIPEDKAQEVLCRSIREVCEIVSRNIKDYNDERKLPAWGNKGDDTIDFHR